MRLLVTGGMGFIGSNFIINHMRKHDDFIYNMDSMTYASNPWYLREIENSKNYSFIKDDINNVKLHEREIENLDIIVNFAAESHVDNSIKDPFPFLRSNVMGTQALLEFARKHDLRFHQISTDEVYGALPDGSEEKFTVDTPYNPRNPYSATKASADMILRSYVNTYGLKGTISNCSNNFGPHQHREKLIPKTIINAIKNESISVYGDGLQVRDWIYVLDHCDAIEIIIEKGKSGDTYLVGADGERTNIEVIRNILRIMGKDESLIKYIQDRPGHDRHYAIDPSSILRLGWKPSMRFEEALSITVNHYISNYKNYL
ncbi:MAG: dTDP-glucose 4,6-dehydratase [Cuniculiplasma sp.]